ncbi:envelope stress response protein PspG [Parasalinivibrio latis]|uniref:envelope stress response protein PspG n=1 Tax=Parasalinivibrio latis TaxID=2952610 RepID=UPI0030E3760C
MAELLFLVGFALMLVVTGVSFLGVALALGVAFVLMLVAGMVGVMFKLLPWLLVIAVGIWLWRKDKTSPAKRYYRQQRRYR